MSTGRRTLRQNTRERLISTDFNRMETFVGADANNILRGLAVRPVDDSAFIGTTFPAPAAGTLAVDVAVPAAPDFGGVIDGLMVVVPIAGTGFTVTAGQLLVIDPDGQPGSSDPNPANPDDPILKYVASAGVTNPALLAWTPNAGPGTRVDVIECQRTDVVQEVDNRDIFNPSTGLFTPTAVTKVTDGELQFRVRLGVTGGGLPAPALGWFPLAIVATPAGAVNLDTCLVWDVRDLLSDRADANARRVSLDGRRERSAWMVDPSQPGEVRLSGQSIVDWAGYRFGGSFGDSNLATPYVRLDLPQYQSAGFVPTAGLIFYVYALFPGGYVRWVPYTATATPTIGGRSPGGYRGVLAVSHIASGFGFPAIAVGTPPTLGLGVSTTVGQVVATGVIGPGPDFLGAIDDGTQTLIGGTTGVLPWQTPVAGVLGGSTVDFAFSSSLNYPNSAKSIRVFARVAFNGFAVLGESAHVLRTIQLLDVTSGNLIIAAAQTDSNVVIRDVSGVAFEMFTFDIPIAAVSSTYPIPAGPIRVRVSYTVTGITAAGPFSPSAAEGLVLGWVSGDY